MRIVGFDGIPFSVLEILGRCRPRKAFRMAADNHQFSISDKDLMPGPWDVQIRKALALHRNEAYPGGITRCGPARDRLQEQGAPCQQQDYLEDFSHTLAKVALSFGTSTHASGKTDLQFTENASQGAKIYQKSDKSFRRDGLLLSKNKSMMEPIRKAFYEAPSTSVFEVKQEGIICVSDPKFNGMNQEEEEW